MKKVYIIHGWGANSNEDWFPWLKKELKNKGFDVYVPDMPNTETPILEEWVSYLSRQIGTLDEQTYLVGHSIGCQTILRYLETIPEKCGGVVFVAGWFRLKNLETKEEEIIAKPWEETPINFDKIKTKAKFVVILSDNDEVVDISNADVFEKKLGAEVIIQKGKGHFNKSDGVTKVPIVLEKILEISNKY